MSEHDEKSHDSAGKKSPGLGPLTKKIGGAPAWIWIVAVVLFAVGVQWYRQRARAATTQALQATAGGAYATDPATAGSGDLPYTPGTPDPASVPQMTTSEWLAAAMKAAKDAGEDPIHALRALNNFLNGGDLSYADTLVVNAALDGVGQSPPGFESIPPGGWADRPLPTASGYPGGGDVSITRLINPSGTPGVFAEYTDGSVRWIHDPAELTALIQNNRSLTNDQGAPNITHLAGSDPIFDRANYGVGGVDAYNAASAYWTGSKTWPPTNPYGTAQGTP